MSRHPFTPSILTFILISGILMTASADIPKVISYQGKVTDTGGNPVADGTYTMRFRIFDASTGGNLEWDSGTTGVGVTSGLFNVLLGENPMPALDLPFDEDYWLLVTFEGINQTPRQRLASTGYTYISGGLVPGAIISGSTAAESTAVLTVNNVATAGYAYGIQGTSTSDRGSGLYGSASSSIGWGNGVSGISASQDGCGVYGHSTTTSGWGSGVKGVTDTDWGPGIHGVATATIGRTFGAYLVSMGDEGYGVYAVAGSPFGSTYGVYAESNSSEGYGVYGIASRPSGVTYGVYGESSSPDGTGVFGKGWDHGVSGECVSESGRAVFGVATSTTGITSGVYGRTYSTDGRGICGYADASSGPAYGVYGQTSSTSGRGVFGFAVATSGDAYGVYGRTYSTDGKGIIGAAGASSGLTFGVYGTASSSDGYAVFGYHPGGWAGGFNGNVDLNGRLELPDYDATGITGSGSVEIGSSLRIDGNEIITNTDEVLYLQRDNNGDIDIDSNTLFLDASTDRVGIDISSPGATLHVNGEMRLGQGLREFELREVMTSDDWGSGIISYEGIGIGSIDGANRQMIMFTDGSGAQNIFTVATSQNSGSSWEADFVVQQNGRVGIGTVSPGYSFQVGTNGDGSEARANAWNLLSSKKYKSNITPLENGEYESILKQLVDTDVVRYHFYRDEHKARHLGIIAEDAPRDIVTRDGEALSLSDYCAFLLAATKAQQKEIEALKARISELEEREELMNAE